MECPVNPTVTARVEQPDGSLGEPISASVDGWFEVFQDIEITEAHGIIRGSLRLRVRLHVVEITP